MHGRAVRKFKGIFEILEAKINSKKNKQTNTEIAIPVAQVLVFGPHMKCIWKRTKQNEKVKQKF